VRIRDALPLETVGHASCAQPLWDP